MRKRSISIKGHRTSVSLEPEFWDALAAFADQDGKSLAALIAEIDKKRAVAAPSPGLASALRVYTLKRLRPKF